MRLDGLPDVRGRPALQFRLLARRSGALCLTGARPRLSRVSEEQGVVRHVMLDSISATGLVRGRRAPLPSVFALLGVDPSEPAPSARRAPRGQVERPVPRARPGQAGQNAS
jgi:hypothetical protein